MAKIRFPGSFRFGIADADLQVIGERNTQKEEGSTPTMWSDFAKRSGKVFLGQGPEEGVDRYHRASEDVELMQRLGIKHYRTSISMARLLDANGRANSKALAWYENYFKRLGRAGIKIYGTLYHWELPQYLSAQGGWTNPRTIQVFLEHVAVVARELGPYLEEYFILNEPWCSAMLGYYLGSHAPGKTSLKSGLTAAHNLLLAQGRAFELIKKIDRSAKIGTVFNSEPSYPARDTDEDRLAADYANGFFNWWFYDALFFGKYPDYMSDLYGKEMPNIKTSEMREIAIGRKLSTLGVNYYTGKLVRFDGKSRLRYAPIVRSHTHKNSLGWSVFTPPIYPEGLFDVLTVISQTYKPKQIYVTENGMALKAPLHDQERISYLRAHLRQVHRAIRAKVPVRGYFGWTLLDNYEWAEGYRPEGRFGLVHVNRKNMTRTLKDSARWYAKVLKTKAIS